MPLRLTDEQKHAAATPAERAYIEAAPGSGKTTVAAERYGVVRYNGSADGRGVLALSFARSARGELENRVRRRWGTGALRWPHRVWTLDSLHHALVVHLLRTGVIEWPGGHTSLTVIDSWRGHGSRPLTADYGFCRIADLNGRRVVSRGTRIGRPIYGFGKKKVYEQLLASGLCTHDEIRQVLGAVVRREDLQPAVREYLAASTKAVIVDEVFDGNVVDLQIVYLAAQAGIPTTVIGDPWQALYDFRGARPELVPRLIDGLRFATFPVSQSFRFQTREMRDMTAPLRDGRPVSISDGAAVEANVVLASRWEDLWSRSDDVLPFSFGQISNQTDAAIGLLLDRLVSAHFGQLSTFGPEAAVILGIGGDVIRADGPAALAPVFDTLVGGTRADAETSLALLRQTISDMGSPRSLRRLPREPEAIRAKRLQALARRLEKGRLVPGLTVHQAKGREWPHVGIHLTAGQEARLRKGLSRDSPEDRLLYVALTRAQQAVWRV